MDGCFTPGRLSPGNAGILVLILPRRVRWSFVDQVLVSGASFLTGVILIRALGLEVFGAYALVLVGVQFLTGVQHSVILSPMMSLFDQRGDVSPARYLGAVVVHQLLLLALVGGLMVLAWLVAGEVMAGLAISAPVALALVASTQVQELVRRYFFVTERPGLAFLSDLVAHGGRLLAVSALAFWGGLSTELVWLVMIATGFAGCLFLLPDLVRAQVDRAGIALISARHGKLSFWMLGNMVVAWFSESGFLLIVVGAVLGTAEVGAVRAVLNLVLVVNLLIQSLENFVPSAASRHLVDGGMKALVSYLLRVGTAGALGILAIAVTLIVLAEPVMDLVYGSSVPGQVMMLAVFGLFLAMGYVTEVAYAGLRALSHLYPAFLMQLVAGVVCVALMVPAAQGFGIAGALLVLLLARVLLATQVIAILQRRVRVTDHGGMA